MDGLSIRKLEGDEAAKIATGTRVEFSLELEPVPSPPRFPMVSEVHRSFDPIAEAEFPYEKEFTQELVMPVLRGVCLPH